MEDHVPRHAQMGAWVLINDRWYENGREGLAILEKEPKIDLLLSDVVLPGGMSGPDLANEAMSRIADLRVLFM